MLGRKVPSNTRKSLVENKSSSSAGFSGTELLFVFIESLLKSAQSDISVRGRGINVRRPSIGARNLVISAQRKIISE